MHEPAKQPRGERFMGTIRAIKLQAPETGGRFAMWGGTFSATNCTLEAIRKKEDSWNKVGSGFVTGSSDATIGCLVLERDRTSP